MTVGNVYLIFTLVRSVSVCWSKRKSVRFPSEFRALNENGFVRVNVYSYNPLAEAHPNWTVFVSCFLGAVGDGGESAEDKEKNAEAERERLEAIREAEERRKEKHRKMEEEREKMRQEIRDKVK